MQLTTQLTLPKIGCQGCMNKVTTAIGNLPAVEVLYTNVASKTVVVRYPSEEVTLEQIKCELDKVKHIVSSAEPYPVEA